MKNECYRKTLSIWRPEINRHRSALRYNAHTPTCVRKKSDQTTFHISEPNNASMRVRCFINDVLISFSKMKSLTSVHYRWIFPYHVITSSIKDALTWYQHRLAQVHLFLSQVATLIRLTVCTNKYAPTTRGHTQA